MLKTTPFGWLFKVFIYLSNGPEYHWVDQQVSFVRPGNFSWWKELKRKEINRA